MAEPETTPSDDDFESRLRQARARESGPERRGRQGREPSSGLGLGMRIGIELVVGVVMGGGLGLALDAWLRTTPWMMILFLLLGGAAGVMNVHRVMRGLDQTVGLGQAEKRAGKARDQ